MPLFLAFLLIPLIEIALFIQVGGAIGLGWTLTIVVLTAVIGTWLVRSQGLAAMARLSQSFGTLRDPSEPLADGAMILFAGALLLTPGFFTDALGFALLAPPVRHAIYRYVASKVKVQSFQSGFHAQTGPGHAPKGQDGDIIDGEYSEVKPKPSSKGPSGWIIETDDQDDHRP